MPLRIKVECYAGYKADERPVRFTRLAPRRATGRTTGSGRANRAAMNQSPAERIFEVKRVVEQWYGEGCQCFRVAADDDNTYVLRHEFEGDFWTLESFHTRKS